MPIQPENIEPMLKESIKHFTTSYLNGASDFSVFESIFFRLIQTMLDPPIEISWFYSAVTFHSSKLTSIPQQTPVTKILLVKDLFQLLMSCSKLSTGTKKIALLAPVVYELYYILSEVTGNYVCLLRREVGDLLENIASYVSVCCDRCENVNEGDDVVVCIEDLLHVWTLGRVGEGCKFGDDVRVIFPVLGDEVRKTVNARCRIEELAGLVLSEVFWLRLSLKMDSEVSAEELLNNTRQWIVQATKGCWSSYLLAHPLTSNLSPPSEIGSFLKESIARFLSKFPQNDSELSLLPISFQYLERDDPPVELIWFHTAVQAHCIKTSIEDKVLLAKDLYRVLTSYSSRCLGLKQVAVLAPVIYVLHDLIIDLMGRDTGALKEIANLVDDVANYIPFSYAFYVGRGVECVEEMPCLADLVRVWTVSHIEVCCDLHVWASFFPLLSNVVRQELYGTCKMENLAGAVMNETFLLRLCLKFVTGTSKEEVERHMQCLIKEMISNFRSCSFFDGLFKMLLEPSLPVFALLSPENATALQKMVYDAVITLDYVSLRCGRYFQSPDKVRKLAVSWALVAYAAIQFARRISDQTSAIAYLHAFSESSLLKQWITNEAVIEEKLRCIRTPRAFIKGMLVLEDQGVRVFDDDVLKRHAKALLTSGCMREHDRIEQEDGYVLQGDQEMVDSQEGGAPACSSSSAATECGRKRKEGREDLRETTRAKHFRYNCHESSVDEKLVPFSLGYGVNAGRP